MTWTYAAAGLLLAVMSLSACTTTDQAGPSVPSTRPSTEPSTTPTEPSDSPFSLAPGGPEVAASAGCAEVRAGIDAFNNGDFEETVERFEAAVPLVEDQDNGSPAYDQLIEAVRWYADLPAHDYPEAAQSSADFQKYKAITLGQCVAGPGAESSQPGVEA